MARQPQGGVPASLRQALGEVMRLQQAGQKDRAWAGAQRLVQRAPSVPDIVHLAALVAATSQRLEQARYYAERACGLDPARPEYRNTLGNVLSSLALYEQAAAELERAVELGPRLVEARVGLGQVYQKLRRREEAEATLREARELAPDRPEASINLALLLIDVAKTGDAIEVLEAAHRRFPRNALVADNLCYALNYADEASPEHVFQVHKRFGELVEAGVRAVTAHANTPDPDRVLRVGYLSADLRRHSVAFFLEPVLRGHRRDRVEAVCYSTSSTRDEMTEHLRSLSDGWCDAGTLGDADLVRRIVSDRVDVLVELGGHSSGHRLITMAARPAPVQVTAIGYPHTTGLTRIDARLVDGVVDPAPEADRFATEELLRLPGCFLCYQPDASCPEPQADTGNDAFTFGSFNELKKISPTTLSLWAEILRRSAGSRLLLKNSGFSDTALRDAFVARARGAGIEPDRLELVGRIESPEAHLALYGRMDLALDTFPYHGTTTTCEAMWMGVPTVTLAGDAHASRVGASLLRAVGLDELATSSPEAYVQRACELARDRGRLASLRAGLRERVASSVLCDRAGYVAHLEDAYRRLWRRWCQERGA